VKPAAATHVINNSRESHVRRAFVHFRHQDLPLGKSDIFFLRLNAYRYSPDKEVGDEVSVKHFWRRRYGRISGGTRVLEPAADSREPTLEKGARSKSTIAHEVEHTNPRGWSSTPTMRRTTAARGAARCGGALVLDRPPPEKTTYGGYWLKRPYARTRHL
jgi:hypothetical protein